MCDSSGTRLRHSPPDPTVVNCKVTQLVRKENGRISRERGATNEGDISRLFPMRPRGYLKFADLAGKFLVLFSSTKASVSRRKTEIRPIRPRNISIGSRETTYRIHRALTRRGIFLQS